MAIDTTAISWAGGTWNILTGCSLASPGCTNCYAMKLAGGRLQNHPSRKGLTVPSKGGPVWTGEVRFNRQWLDQPLRRKTPTVIFVCAHSDLFHPQVTDEVLDEIFGVMAACPWHLFLVLTKRIDRARRYLEAVGLEGRVFPYWAGLQPRPPAHPFPTFPLPNLWVGTSVEDQQRVEERLPELVATPAALRFVSAEPILGPVMITPWLSHIGLVIAGGESQRGARWLPTESVRSLRDQCRAAGTVFHFKQWGAWLPRDQVTSDAQREAIAKATWETAAGGLGTRSEAVAYNVGPAIAGHLLDGIEYREMPPWPSP